MLKIRLARGGKHKTPFFRIVLTEHTKPVKSGYKLVLGRFDPLKHTAKIDIDAIKAWISKGAQPSNRVAKLLKKETNDKFWDTYITLSTSHKKPKNAPEEESKEEVKDKVPAETKEETTKETKEEVTEETPKEETAKEITEEKPVETKDEEQVTE